MSSQSLSTVSVSTWGVSSVVLASFLFAGLATFFAAFFAPSLASAQPYSYGGNAPSGYTSAYGNQPTLKPLQGSNPAPANNAYNYGNASSSGAYSPSSSVAPSYQAVNQGYGAPMLQGRVSTAPAGSTLAVNLNTSISSQFARVGDRVSATLSAPLISGGQVLLPAGTMLDGQVASANGSGRTGRPGELDLRFSQATTPSGNRVPLSARIQTNDGTGLLKAGTTKGRVGKAALGTAIGAGLGAALGTAMGPLSGGSVGKGAIYGTALGATAGAATALFKKGDDIEVAAGSPITVVLDTPVTVSGASESSNYSAPNNSGSYNYGGSPTAPTYQSAPSNFYAPSGASNNNGSGFYRP
jgi:hypothetical protein